MNNDIIPPRPPAPQPPKAPESPIIPTDTTPQAVAPSFESPAAAPVPQPALAQSSDERSDTQTQEVGEPTAAKKSMGKYAWLCIITGGVILIVAACIAWYLLALRPVAGGDAARIQVAIPSGSSPAQIGAILQKDKVIRSQAALEIYVRLHGVRSKLLAGTYSLSPAESTGQIVGHLTVGSAEQYDVTFYPGATLNIASTANDKTPSHRQVLEKLGFSTQEIDDAFNASYAEEYPLLFSDKPMTADLEGYIYGQTYKVASGSSVKQILRRTFDEYEKQIQANNLVELYKKQNLSLYQGITLASIIQREVPTVADQKQVAQIFFTRLRSGMMLGSDVTYHYAADKAGTPRDHMLNSPYNTRKVAGLPPGPIASPGISALLAVAEPAPGDYVYFLSGDDDKTYFARTNAEHEANIANHCAYKCSLP